VTIDNDVYNREAAGWRDENNLLSLLVALTPPRVAYIHQVLTQKMGLDPQGRRALDVGCGGGLMAEEVARMGCRVTGIDPSDSSLDTARRHAAEVGLEIEYRHGTAESLPVGDGTFDLVYCCDVLEHVGSVDAAIGEAARVLKPGGIYIYDTINRTVLSKLVVIKVAQEWRFTRFFSANFHVWSMFIRPVEMRRMLEAHGLEHREFSGLGMTGNPITLLRVIRKLKRGRATYGDVGAALARSIRPGRNLQVSYLGYAVKRRETAGESGR
jgi:2-polyprenyl-6-hydroxyphenyl methylase/3-demethylubiquinone-9 3-methyltransferase